MVVSGCVWLITDGGGGLSIEPLMGTQSPGAPTTRPWLIAIIIAGSLLATTFLVRGYVRAAPPRTRHRLTRGEACPPRGQEPSSSHPCAPVPVESGRSDALQLQLAIAETGQVVRTYAREAAALAFIRDVVFLRGRQDAAQFTLRTIDVDNRIRTLAEGDALVQRAVEDRVL